MDIYAANSVIVLFFLCLLKCGLPSVIFLWIMLHWYKNPGSLEKCVSIFYAFMQKIGFCCYDYFDKKKIKAQFESTFKSTLNEISQQGNDIASHEFKIEWINSDDAESDFKNGVIFIRIKKSNNKTDSMVKCIHLFVKAALFPEIKKVLSTEQQESLDLYMTYLFTLNMDTFHRKCYKDGILTNSFKNPIIDGYYKKYDDIYKHGYLRSILIHEISAIEKQHAARISIINTTALHDDIDKLIDVILEFSHRKQNQKDENFNVTGRYIKALLVIIARHEKASDITPYLDYIERKFDDGFIRIYVSSQRKLDPTISTLCENLNHRCRIAAKYGSDTVIHKPTGDIDFPISVSVLEKIESSGISCTY